MGAHVVERAAHDLDLFPAARHRPRCYSPARAALHSEKVSAGGAGTLPRSVGRIRQAPVRVVAAAAIAVCVVTTAGCGGGGDDNASGTTTAAQIPTVTTTGSGESRPPGNGSSSTTRTTPGNEPPAPGNLPQGAQPAQQALAQFRDCLSRHGVSPQFLNPGGALRARQRNPEEFRAQVEKAFACIPELPPQLRASAERFKRRFEQANR